ncbi:MAG: hypothetical protein AAFR59_08705 [Bacteroidota bacterium]
MKPDLSQEKPTCVLCGREVDQTTRHHLIPRTVHRNKWFKKRYSKAEMDHTIDLCKPCHRQVHLLIDHKTLGREFNTLEKLKAHEDIQTFVKWIQKR